MQGVVKWFNSEKGYGFISSGNKDYFVHFREIKVDGFKTLEAGASVSFEPDKTPKGMIAKNVTVSQ